MCVAFSTALLEMGPITSPLHRQGNWYRAEKLAKEQSMGFRVLSLYLSKSLPSLDSRTMVTCTLAQPEPCRGHLEDQLFIPVRDLCSFASRRFFGGFSVVVVWLVWFVCCFVVDSEQPWDFSYHIFPWMRGLRGQAGAAHTQRRGIYLCVTIDF